jgi:hypothetical protein
MWGTTGNSDCGLAAGCHQDFLYHFLDIINDGSVSKDKNGLFPFLKRKGHLDVKSLDICHFLQKACKHRMEPVGSLQAPSGEGHL